MSAADGAERERQLAAIEEWRQRIDTVDDQLVRLLNSRSVCAVEIGRIKRVIGEPIYAPDRERRILERLEQTNPGPLDGLAVRRLFERIIDESRRLERLAAEQEPGAAEGPRSRGEEGSRESQS